MKRFMQLCSVVAVLFALGCGGSGKQAYIPTGDNVKPFRAPETSDLREDDGDEDDADYADEDTDSVAAPAPKAAKPADTPAPVAPASPAKPK